MKDKKLDLDFDLDSENNKSKTEELDLLLKNKSMNNNIKDKDTLEIYHRKMKEIEVSIQKKETKDKRLQTYISKDLWHLVQAFKSSNNIKTDSDAIELLLKIALKRFN